MKPFNQLSRIGRLRRMRQLARAALEPFGLSGAGLRFLQYGENVIYRVDTGGPSAGKDSPYLPNRHLLRIHAIGDVEAIASELTWLAALNQEAGLAVPAPVPAVDGKLFAALTTPGMSHARVVTLMRWLDGKKYSRGLRPKHLIALGQVVAQMHDFAAGWQPPVGFTRFHWDWDSQLGGSMFSHSREELVASMPLEFQEPFQTVSQEVKRVMEGLGKGSDAYGLIHADLYPENVLFKGAEAYPIDFEDCGYGYWIWDIAVALCTWAWKKDWARMRDAFREGYSRVRLLPEAQWAHLDLFVATQFATMVIWASAFLKHDPLRVAEYTPWRDDNGVKLLGYFRR